MYCGVTIAKRWELRKDNEGLLVLVDRISHSSVYPDDTLKIFDSWGEIPARIAIRRYYANKHYAKGLTKAQRKKVDDYCAIDRKTSHIHIRISPERKAKYMAEVRQSRFNSLSEWVLGVCDGHVAAAS